MYPYYNNMYYNDQSRNPWGFGVPFLGGLLLGGLATTVLGGPGFYGGGYPYYGYSYGYPYYF